jgi:hypothetical protein
MVLLERSQTDPAFLQAIIQDHFSKAEVAKAAVWEKCHEDAGYLRSVLRSYLPSLHEAQILAILEESLGRPILSKRLGFDPLDPAR